jgi:hypothetical protein
MAAGLFSILVVTAVCCFRSIVVTSMKEVGFITIITALPCGPARDRLN